MFTLTKYYEKYWKMKPEIWRTKFHRESFSKKPIPVQININDLEKTFKNEYNLIFNSITNILPNDLISDLENIIKNNEKFKPELWAKIVYHYAASYKRLEENDEKSKYKLLDTLKTLWIGRFVSYAKQVEEMDINDAEKVIQDQAEIFEKNFNYLKSIF
jgi:hypothetical protein